MADQNISQNDNMAENISPELTGQMEDRMETESRDSQLQRPNSESAASETWTIIDKEDIEAESDAESIEVISEDESVGSKSTSSSTSYVHLSDETNLIPSSISIPSGATTSNDGSVKDQETQPGTSHAHLEDEKYSNQDTEQRTQDEEGANDNANSCVQEIEQGSVGTTVADLEDDNSNDHDQDFEQGIQDVIDHKHPQDIEQGTPDVMGDDALDSNQVTGNTNPENILPQKQDNGYEISLQQGIALRDDAPINQENGECDHAALEPEQDVLVESESKILNDGLPGTSESETIKDVLPGTPESETLKDGLPGTPESEILKDGLPGTPESETIKDGLPGTPESETLKDGLPGTPESETLKDGFPGTPESGFQGIPLLSLDEDRGNYLQLWRDWVCRHTRNSNVSYLLSGLLVVVLAMVISVRVGQFRGIWEQMEIDMAGSKEMAAEDQNAHKSIVLQLKNENEHLRKELEWLKNKAKNKGEEAVLDTLKKKMDMLVAENVDLEEKVARLRIAADKDEQVDGTVKHDSDSEDVPKSDWSSSKEEVVAEVSKWLLYGLNEAQKTVTKFGNILEKDESGKSHFGINLEEDWPKKLNEEVSNIMMALENKWEEIKNEWENGNRNAYAEKPTEESEKENLTDSSYNDWNSNRGEGRQKWRMSNGKADWLFERAKYRDDHRQEERKSEWYFEKKFGSNDMDFEEDVNKDDKTCFKDSDDCQAENEDQNILRKANKWKKIIKEKANRWGEIIGKGAKAWGKPIKEKSLKWGKVIGDEAEAWGKPIKEKANKWGEIIEEEARAWGKPIKEKSRKWGKYIKEEAKEWKEGIKNKANKWGKVIKEEARAWGNPIKEKAGKWGKMLKEETNVWRKPIKQNVNKWGEIIKEEANEWGGIIKEKTNRWGKVINEEAYKWGDYIKENINDYLDKKEKKKWKGEYY